MNHNNSHLAVDKPTEMWLSSRQGRTRHGTLEHEAEARRGRCRSWTRTRCARARARAETDEELGRAGQIRGRRRLSQHRRLLQVSPLEDGRVRLGLIEGAGDGRSDAECDHLGGVSDLNESGCGCWAGLAIDGF